MFVGVKFFSEVLRMCVEIFYYLRNVLKVRGYNIMVGDEGGFVLNLKFNEELLEVIVEVIEKVGYIFGKDIVIVFDFVILEFYNEEDGKYYFEREGKVRIKEEMVEFWVKFVEKYFIVLIEDGVVEEDWEGWKMFIEVFGNKI